MKKALNRVDSC